jgi:hypothetical protein
MQAQAIDAQLNLPDAPAVSPQQSASPTPQTQTQTPAPANGAPGSQSTPAQSGAGQSTEEAQRKKAQEQLEQQEHQRVMGVMSAFNTTSNPDAVPLSAGQKFQLFFKSATDPWPFVLTGVVAGIGQATNDTPEYGQGVEGYAKRYGADYGNYFIGNFFGNAVLPSLLHEDPRYFQKRTGSFASRALWAAGSTVWCKRDNGTWGPNYSNVVGNLIGAAIANVYEPDAQRTVGTTVENGLTVTVEGIVGAEVIEFWPDIVRRHRRKQAEKLAKQATKDSSQPAPPPPPSPAPQKPQD